MRLLAAIGLALAAAVLLAPGPVAAQGKGRKKAAREHYQKAKAFQEAGRYAEAIAEYEEAHEAVPDPAFIYNIARCLHLSGEREQAIEKYEQYLDQRARGEIAEEAKSFAAELRAELAAEKEAAEEKAAREEAAARERARNLTAERAAAGSAEEKGGGGPSIDLVREEERPAPRRSTARRVAWVAGGAALIGGGLLVDTMPDSGHNGTLEATDFVPVGLYLAGLAAVALGVF